MPTLHSHTHWQAPEAITQTKAYQRVCLSNPEKKKIKISRPSKNLKNAIPQPDRKTFGLVAKLNIDKGCETRTTRTPGYNSTYKKLAVQWLNEALCFVSSSVVADSFRLRNRQLPVAAKRYAQYFKDSKDLLSLKFRLLDK
jgi:hypothetical protein